MAGRKRWLQQGGGIIVVRPSRQHQGSSEGNWGLTTKKLKQDHWVTWSIWKWLTGWLSRKPQPIPQPIRRKVDTQSIRARIGSLGWQVREIPIRKSSPVPEERLIASWRLIAARGERSIEVSGPNIDEAFKTLGVTLGVIPRE